MQGERECPPELVKSQINNLFSELIPAIKQFCPSVSISANCPAAWENGLSSPLICTLLLRVLTRGINFLRKGFDSLG